MLDIVILTPWFPNSRDGWPARFISDSAQAIAAQGNRVRVGVLRGFAPPGLNRWIAREHRGQIERATFTEIDEIQLRRYAALPKGLLRRLTNRSLDRAVRQLLQSFVSERRPDAVLVHTEGLAPGAVGLAHEMGLPVLVTLHGENTNTSYLSGGGQSERFRAALSEVDKLVIVGEPLRDYACRLAGRGDHIEVVWNGVEPPEHMRAAPNPDIAPLELITVANLQEGKGIDILLSALEQLHREGLVDWRLNIVGEGPMGELLRQQASAAALVDRIHFSGPMSNAQVFKELVKADVFVLPSYREAFGVAYLEAMASGLLTIGVHGQGPAHFITHGETGILVAPRSIVALADALRPVIGGARSEWRPIAARGAAFARSSTTWSAHATNMVASIRSVVDRPKTQAGVAEIE